MFGTKKLLVYSLGISGRKGLLLSVLVAVLITGFGVLGVMVVVVLLPVVLLVLPLKSAFTLRAALFRTAVR